MKIKVIGKGYTVSDRVETQIENKLKKINKLFKDDVNVTVHVISETPFKRVEIMIELPKHGFIKVDEKDKDLYAAIDLASDKLAYRLRKYKDKLKDKYKSSDSYIEYEQIESYEEQEDMVINKIKNFPAKPMSPEEAALQMEMVGHDFFVFQNQDTSLVNVIYKRKKGGYGLIITE